MSELVKFNRNEQGRDFVVGDIHGCYSLLMDRLRDIGFDKKKDRLFSVGDLVDRGPESMKCLSLPYEPWFFAVRGNHEALMHDAVNGGDMGLWLVNGGTWAMSEDMNDLRILVNDVMERLPVAMEVDTSAGKVGIIHADVTSGQWGDFDSQRDVWSRERIQAAKSQGYRPVAGIDQVFVGHTILMEPASIDNVTYLDTGAFHTGKLTIWPIEDGK